MVHNNNYNAKYIIVELLFKTPLNLEITVTFYSKVLNI